jgi:hypothetical protein
VIKSTLMPRRPLSTILLAILLLVFFEREARAYADPGSGALLWQILVAGFMGALFYARRVFGWIRGKSRKGHER